MNEVTKTFKKPYYVVIFISNVNKADFLFNEANLKMVDLVPQQPGFLGMDRGRMENGLGFSISYWESLEAIELWRENQLHSTIQNNARESWLSEYTLRTAKVEYDYHFNMNDIAEPIFSIEDQAVLYALIVKNLDCYYPDKANQIAREIIRTMANEQGQRMAQRCLNDNKPLTARNFLLYSEWDNKEQYNEYTPSSFENGYALDVVKCGWNDAWQKYDMLEYSIDYCSEIDKGLVHGFNPEIEFEVSQFLTTGNSYCDFKWSEHVFENIEEFTKFNVEREEISSRVTKNFLYHTAHLYSCFSKIINEYIEYDLAGKILLSVIADYKKIFSTQKSDLIIKKSKDDFSRV